MSEKSLRKDKRKKIIKYWEKNAGVEIHIEEVEHNGVTGIYVFGEKAIESLAALIERLGEKNGKK